MVNAVYDHIVAILIICVMFVSAVVVLPSLSIVNMQAVDNQQLRNIALNLFNTLLLDAGRPPDWGSKYPFNPRNIEIFGLAYPEECSQYVLDANKVQRLDKESPWFINYSRVRELLKLGKYGFTLEFFRPFTIKWSLNIVANRVLFAVNVTRSGDEFPVPNAQVELSIIVMARNIQNPKDDPVIIVNTPRTFYTDPLGRCKGNETISLTGEYTLERAVAIIKVTVGGMSSMVVAQTSNDFPQNWLKINTFGDTITLTFRGEFINDTKGVRRVYDIMAYTYGGGLTQVYDGRNDHETSRKITNGLGFDYWNKTFPGLSAMEPVLLLFTVSVPEKREGRKEVILVGPFLFWDSLKVFSFRPDTEYVGSGAIKLRRFVVISGMTYVAELTLWKEH